MLQYCFIVTGQPQGWIDMLKGRVKEILRPTTKRVRPKKKKIPIKSEQILSLLIQEPRDRSLIYFLYLSGTRIGEALKVTPGDFKKNDKVLTVEIQTEKNPWTDSRIIPLMDNTKNKPFLKEIKARISKTKPGEPLWDFTRMTAWRICKKHINRGTHEGRKSRASYISEAYDFDSFELCHFFGWSKLDSARPYIHRSTKSIINKMRRKT